MSVELADHDGTRKERRPTEIDTRLLARRLAANRNFSSRGVHVDPTALLVASRGILRSGILPGLLKCVPYRRMAL
jgi:hypothetical protein